MQTWIRANIGALKERAGTAETNITNILARLGGISIVKCTTSEYGAMSTHDPNTLYVVLDDDTTDNTTVKKTTKRSAKK